MKKDNLKDKISLVNKCYNFFFTACECVWEITDFVFLYPCKFARQLRVIMFPFDKILEPIPWNDCNFNVVIEAMPGCDMRKPIDIMIFNGPRGGDCNVTFKA